MSVEYYYKTLKDIFELLHDEDNKRFFEQLIILTKCDDENNSYCALTDENVRYGTDDYQLFEKAVKSDFSSYEAEQILNYEIKLFDRDYYLTALGTAIPYYVDEEKTQKKLLYVTAYPKDEFEETKAYRSRSPFSDFRF